MRAHQQHRKPRERGRACASSACTLLCHPLPYHIPYGRTLQYHPDIFPTVGTYGVPHGRTLRHDTRRHPPVFHTVAPYGTAQVGRSRKQVVHLHVVVLLVLCNVIYIILYVHLRYFCVLILSTHISSVEVLEKEAVRGPAPRACCCHPPPLKVDGRLLHPSFAPPFKLRQHPAKLLPRASGVNDLPFTGELMSNWGVNGH